MEVRVFRTPDEQRKGVHLETYRPHGKLPVGTIYFFPHVGDHAKVVSHGIHEPLRVYFLDQGLRVIAYVDKFGGGEIGSERFTPPGTAHVVETSVDTPELNNFGFLAPHFQ